MFKIWHEIYKYSTSQLVLGTFQVLNNHTHMWFVSTTLNSGSLHSIRSDMIFTSASLRSVFCTQACGARYDRESSVTATTASIKDWHQTICYALINAYLAQRSEWHQHYKPALINKRQHGILEEELPVVINKYVLNECWMKDNGFKET